MFPEAKTREIFRSKGYKIHCFPWEQSLSVLMSYLPTQNVLEKPVKKSFALRRLARKFTAVSRSTT